MRPPSADRMPGGQRSAVRARGRETAASGRPPLRKMTRFAKDRFPSALDCCGRGLGILSSDERRIELDVHYVQ